MSALASAQCNTVTGYNIFIPGTSDVQTAYGGVFAKLAQPQLTVDAVDAAGQQGIQVNPQLPVIGLVQYDVDSAFSTTNFNAYTPIQNTTPSPWANVDVDITATLTAPVVGTFYYVQSFTDVGSTDATLTLTDGTNPILVIQPGDSTLYYILYTGTWVVRSLPVPIAGIVSPQSADIGNSVFNVENVNPGLKSSSVVLANMVTPDTPGDQTVWMVNNYATSANGGTLVFQFATNITTTDMKIAYYCPSL